MIEINPIPGQSLRLCLEYLCQVSYGPLLNFENFKYFPSIWSKVSCFYLASNTWHVSAQPLTRCDSVPEVSWRSNAPHQSKLRKFKKVFFFSLLRKYQSLRATSLKISDLIHCIIVWYTMWPMIQDELAPRPWALREPFEKSNVSFVENMWNERKTLHS